MTSVTPSPVPSATYDPEADALGVYFAPPGGQYDGSEEIAPGVTLDYDAEGRVIGVEILHLRHIVADGLDRPDTEEPAAE